MRKYMSPMVWFLILIVSYTSTKLAFRIQYIVMAFIGASILSIMLGKGAGAHALRGGAFKPRTSPYSFQGLGEQGLKYLEEAREETGLPIVSEVVDVESFPIVEASVDVIQIGARNMQNYTLLKRAGRSQRPILLKRGISASLDELLSAAEYIMSEGNSNIILCERGIRTQCNHTRFTLDLSSIPVLRTMTHLPLIVDPSHAAGMRDIVIPLARAGLAIGSDGLIIEAHVRPDEALVDGSQSLTIDMLSDFMEWFRYFALRSTVPKMSLGVRAR